MATVRVVFFGQISQIGKKHEKKHAVLIDDFQTHKPHIYFGPRGRVDLGRGKIRFQDGRGKVIKGRADSTDPQFQMFVPHLIELTNGDIKQSVDQGSNKTHVYAYFDYPGGNLQARTLYECRAQYTMPGKIVTQCVAKTVLLTATVDAESIHIVYPTLDGSTDTRDVTDTCLLITNAEHVRRAERERLAKLTDCNTTTSTHEFKKHKDVMDASIIAALKQSGPCRFPFDPPNEEGCSWVDAIVKGFRDSFEVECGNSQYP